MRRAGWWAAGAVAAVVVVVAVGLAAAGRGSVGPAPSTSATSSSTADAPVPTVSSPAAPSSPAPAATSGLTDQAARDVQSALGVEPGTAHTDPVVGEAEAHLGGGLTVTVGQVTKVDGRAHGPGEVAGPAFLIPVTIRNDGPSNVALTSVIANVYGALGYPGGILAGDDRNVPFDGTLAPGSSAAGAYVVTVPEQGGPEYVATIAVVPDQPAAVVVFTPRAG